MTRSGIESRWGDRPPLPQEYETEVVRLADPEGAAALDRAKAEGYLVLGNDVGDRRDPNAGLSKERSAKDQLVWEAYASWCGAVGKPLVWVGVVMTGTSQSPFTGRMARADPAAEVRLRVG